MALRARFLEMEEVHGEDFSDAVSYAVEFMLQDEPISQDAQRAFFLAVVYWADSAGVFSDEELAAIVKRSQEVWPVGDSGDKPDA